MAGKRRSANLSSGAAIAIAIVIIAVIVVAVVWYRKGSIEGFAGADTDYHLVMFKAEWCGYCQKALPGYKSLMTASNGSELADGKKLYFDIIDPDIDTDRIVISEASSGQQIQVKAPYAASQSVIIYGFPTFVLYGRPTGPTRYTGPLDRDSIAAFIAAA